MRISPETIQQIQLRTDIMEVVGDFVSLKKKGQNYWACCPFHNEKTPSFSINPAKGIFKCFGCGKGGDAYNIEIAQDTRPTDQQLSEQNERESLLGLHDFAQKYYQEILNNHPDGQAIGLNYFKERGFNLKTVAEFELGYSLKEWDAFTKYAHNQGFTYELLEKSGLTIKTEKGSYIDRFRDRVMFPIHNVSGKTIAFGGRILTNDKKQAKYLNSPETPIYHKSQVLYGLYQAKKTIREQDNCYLVEGYTDVISLHQADILNVVASSGTSLTVEQIRLIRRSTPNVTVLYDGDVAGIKASLRGIDLLLEEDLNVKVVMFPAGEDPDSYVKKLGTTAFQDFLQNNHQDFITFKAQIYLQDAKNDLIKRAEMIHEIVSSIVKIPDEIKQRIFYQECSRLLQIDEASLVNEGAKLLQKKTNQNQSAPQNLPPPLFDDEQGFVIQVPDNEQVVSPQKEIGVQVQERELIRLLLNYGTETLKNGQKLVVYVLAEIEDLEFEHPTYQEILKKIRQDTKYTDFQALMPVVASETKSIITDLITEKYNLSENWEKKYFVLTPRETEQLDQLAIENILRLKLYQVHKLIHENEQKLTYAETDSEQDQYLLIGLRLESVRKTIAQQLNNVVLKG
ncbi:MAG: DNA primase [Microscillaceae bacterium]|nr:DNA primase [Microscillaceae bacterium]